MPDTLADYVLYVIYIMLRLVTDLGPTETSSFERLAPNQAALWFKQTYMEVF